MTATDTTHECPGAHCDRRLPFDRFACPSHWRRLPGKLRRALQVAWREGDLEAHADARADCVEWLRRNP